MSAGDSAEAWARQLQRTARKGVWGHVTAWLGMNPAAAVADVKAARIRKGAEGERATARLLKPLRRQGWSVWHDMKVGRRKFNLDHVLTSPCGTTVLVLDSKAWDARESTRLVRGRVVCGRQDWHGQVESLAGYTEPVAAALGLPVQRVVPMLVVHGSHVEGGALWAPVPGVHGRLLVVGADRLVGTLTASSRVRDPRAARVLAARVDGVLRPYVQGA